MPTKLICPKAGTCETLEDSKFHCSHALPHCRGGACGCVSVTCSAICLEATSKLMAKIEAERILNNY